MSNHPAPPLCQRLLLLIIIALLAYLPTLLLLEVKSGPEAAIAAIAREMAEDGNLLRPMLQGHPVPVFPLYPWLVCLFQKAGLPDVMAVRLPALLAIWLLALLCGLMARWCKILHCDTTPDPDPERTARHGNLAGIIAAGMVLTSHLAMTALGRTQAEAVLALLLTAAWFSWYSYGPRQERWGLAWGFALFFVFLGVLAVGAKVIPLFYLPLLFCKVSPYDCRNRQERQQAVLFSLPDRDESWLFRQLQTPAHLLSLGLFITLLLLWLKLIMPHPFLGWNSYTARVEPFSPETFFSHALVFPFRSMLHLFPWCLFAWPPFCLALRQFEPKNSLAPFLRRILIVGFIFFWAIPGTQAFGLLHLLGPIAILTGIHFDFIERRRYPLYHQILRFFYALNQSLTLLTALIWLAIAAGLLVFDSQTTLGNPRPLTALAVTAALLCLAGINRRINRVMPPTGILPATPAATRPVMPSCSFCVRILWTILMASCLVSATYLPWKYLTIDDDRLAARLLLAQAPPYGIQIGDRILDGETHLADTLPDFRRDRIDLYLHSTNRYLQTAFYLQAHIRRISDPSLELPETEPVVYLLSNRLPAVPNRRWEALSPTVNFALRRRISLEFQGRPWQSPLLICARTRLPVDGPLQNGSLPALRKIRSQYHRLYRGTLKN